MATLPKVDVLIVGLGAAGCIAAKELSTAGMKVVGLEWGPLRRTVDFHWNRDELKYEDRQFYLKPLIDQQPMTYRTSNADTAVNSGVPWTIYSGVGGGTNHYGTWHWRMLPHHFKIRSDTIAHYGESALPSGTNIVDWPITYDDLAPYYDKVDTEIGISGQTGNLNGAIQSGGNPFEGPRDQPFPMPPLLQNTSARIFKQAATALGYEPFPTPSSIASQTYNGRAPCDYDGFCSPYACQTGAKGSTMVTVFPLAVASGNFEYRTGCRAIKVNQAGGVATSVTYIDQAGVEQEQPASLIILSNYTYGIVRLLLLSGITHSGLVGKWLMSHEYNIVNSIIPGTITNPAMGGFGSVGSMDEFNGDNFDHTGLGFIEGASITSLGFTHAIGGSSSVVPAYFQGSQSTATWGQDYKDFLKQYANHTFGLIAQLPCLPYDTNVIDLDPTVKDSIGMPVLRVTYNGHQNEVNAGTFLQGKMTEIVKQAGATMTLNGPYLIPPWNNHEVGPCRMGTDPAKSVVNEHLQSWDLPNMFIMSGAVFPTYFGYNPTQTIEALTYYSSDYIKTESQSGGSLAQYF